MTGKTIHVEHCWKCGATAEQLDVVCGACASAEVGRLRESERRLCMLAAKFSGQLIGEDYEAVVVALGREDPLVSYSRYRAWTKALDAEQDDVVARGVAAAKEEMQRARAD